MLNGIEVIEILEFGFLNNVIVSLVRILMFGVGAWLIVFVMMSVYYRARLNRSLFIDRFIRPDKSNRFFMLMRDAVRAENQKYLNKDKGKRNPEGFVVGKTKENRYICIPEDQDFHVLGIGGTGSGKTSGIVIPTLRAWGLNKKPGRAFVIDISGDICKNTTKYRRKKLVFDPINRKGNAYDPFYELRRCKHVNDMIDPVARMAYAIIPSNPEESANAKYFTDNGRKILQAGIFHFYRKGYGFIEAMQAIAQMSIDELLADIFDDNVPYTRTLIAGFVGIRDNLKSECKQTCNDALEIFATRTELAHFMRNKKSPKENVIHPGMIEHADIYIILPEKDLEVYAPLLRLITSQFLGYFSAREGKTPVLMCLDELGRLGAIQGFRETLQTVRKRNVHVCGFTQGISDLRSNYGELETDSILQNFTHKICLGANDPKTQEYFANLVGRNYEEKSSYSFNASHENYGQQSQLDYIIEPQEMAYMQAKKELLYISPKGYKKLKVNSYYDPKEIAREKKRYKKIKAKRGKR